MCWWIKIDIYSLQVFRWCSSPSWKQWRHCSRLLYWCCSWLSSSLLSVSSFSTVSFTTRASFAIPVSAPSHSTTSRVMRVVSWPGVSCVSSRACFNVADDEEAVVLACTSLVICALDLHQSQEQLLKKVRWTCPPQSTLWRRPEHVSCVSLCAVRQARQSTSRLFLVPKFMG